MNFPLLLVIGAVCLFVAGKPLVNDQGENHSKPGLDHELDELRNKVAFLEEELLSCRLAKLEKHQINSNHQSAIRISGTGHNIVIVMPINNTGNITSGDQFNQHNRDIHGKTGSYMNLTPGETENQIMEK